MLDRGIEPATLRAMARLTQLSRSVADRVVLITGAASGMGRATAHVFADEGARVAVTDLDQEKVDAVVAEIRGVGGTAEGFVLDVADLEQIHAVVDAVQASLGDIDILVNNAGIFRTVGLVETSMELWTQMVSINQTGVFLGMRTAAVPMKAQGNGSIVNISSIAGMKSAAIAHAYAATKWAVRGMSKSAAVELAPHGVRVNSVHPGIIETQMLEEFGGARETITERIPLGRTATAGEVADLVCFLASEDSSYCTGQEFVIDGAMTA